MRPSKIRVAKYEHSATSKWVVEGLRNNAGKRSRRFFRTKAEADHFARDSLAERRQFGSSSAALPADLRLSAINCAEKLKPYGKTLEEATEALIKSLKAVPTHRKTVSSANLYQLFAYLKNKEKDPGWENCEGILLYPTVKDTLDLNYTLGGHRVRIYTINLNQHWSKISDELKLLISDIA